MTSPVSPSNKIIDLKGLLEGPPPALNNDGKSVTARLLVDSRCNLGEGILYDDEQDAIVFTNILGTTFNKISLKGETDAMETWKLPKMLCALGLRPASQPGYVCAWEDGFQLYDLEQGKALGPMSEGEKVDNLGLPDRMNDGRVDPSGRRFICGGHAPSGTKIKVYRCEALDGKLVHAPVVDEISTTNSICWSPDGTIMYLADSPTEKIHKYDYQDGKLSNKQHFHDKATGVADGSCVDSEGYVWNAVWRNGDGPSMVQRIDPSNGHVVFEVNMPDTTSCVSCCCFGGKNLDILFITSARENIDPSKEIYSGGIYAVKLEGITGRKESRFLTD